MQKQQLEVEYQARQPAIDEPEQDKHRVVWETTGRRRGNGPVEDTSPQAVGLDGVELGVLTVEVVLHLDIKVAVVLRVGAAAEGALRGEGGERREVPRGTAKQGARNVLRARNCADTEGNMREKLILLLLLLLLLLLASLLFATAGVLHLLLSTLAAVA
jgi:hypothetical protein